MAFDQEISNIQRNLGVTFGAFSKNAQVMSDLVQSGQSFGVSMEQTFKSVTQLGEILKTNNIVFLAESVKQTQAISGALGVSVEEATALQGAMQRYGASAEMVKGSAQMIAKYSAQYGVSSKAVFNNISKNFEKYKTLGFIGGEQSLIRMTAYAEKLNMEISDTFQLSEKMRGLEGSVEVAANAQMLGGSLAKAFGDPMKNLSMARGNIEQLNIAISKMGDDMGHIDEKGNFFLDSMSHDRLMAMSKNINIPFEKLNSMIAMQAVKNKKMSLLPANLISPDMKDEDKEFLLSALSFSKDGKALEITGLEGIKDFNQLSPDLVKKLSNDAAQKRSDLESVNKQNQSVKESWENFTKSLLNVATVLQPVMEGISWILTGLMSAINSFRNLFDATWAKSLVSIGSLAAILTLMYGQKIWMGLITGLKGLGSGFVKGGLSSMFGGGVDKTFKKAGGGSIIPGEKGSGGILESLAKGLSAFASTKVIIGAFNLALTATMLGFALWPFAKALNMMGEVKWGAVLASFGFIALAVGALSILGGFITGGGGLLLLAAGGALIAVGISLIAFAYALQISAKGFQALAEVKWSSLDGVGGTLLKLSAGLLAFGYAGVLFTNPVGLAGMAIMLGTLGSLALIMIPLSASLIKASEGMSSMAKSTAQLSTAIKSLDMDKLAELNKISSNLSGGNAVGGILSKFAGMISGGGSSSNQTIKIDPIHISVEMDGKVIYKENIKAGAHKSGNFSNDVVASKTSPTYGGNH